MDEHKPQEQAPEKVPARRKSGRMRGWKASILACVTCILVTALVTSMIFVGKFGGSSNYKLALKFAQVKQVVDKDYIGARTTRPSATPRRARSSVPSATSGAIT